MSLSEPALFFPSALHLFSVKQIKHDFKIKIAEKVNWDMEKVNKRKKRHRSV